MGNTSKETKPPTSGGKRRDEVKADAAEDEGTVPDKAATSAGARSPTSDGFIYARHDSSTPPSSPLRPSTAIEEEKRTDPHIATGRLGADFQLTLSDNDPLIFDCVPMVEYRDRPYLNVRNKKLQDVFKQEYLGAEAVETNFSEEAAHTVSCVHPL
eukprot:g8886.t1